MRKTFALCFIVFFFASYQPALSAGTGNETPQRITSHMKPEWLACKETNDCKIFNYNCSEVTAVNAGYLSEAKKVICDVESCETERCFPSWLKDKKHPKATCINGQCAVEWLSGEVPIIPLTPLKKTEPSN